VIWPRRDHDSEEAAARAFDRVLLRKCGSLAAQTNFPAHEYEEEMTALLKTPMNLLVAQLRERAARDRLESCKRPTVSASASVGEGKSAQVEPLAGGYQEGAPASESDEGKGRLSPRATSSGQLAPRLPPRFQQRVRARGRGRRTHMRPRKAPVT
jgi:hypothetical protein